MENPGQYFDENASRTKSSIHSRIKDAEVEAISSYYQAVRRIEDSFVCDFWKQADAENRHAEAQKGIHLVRDSYTKLASSHQEAIKMGVNLPKKLTALKEFKEAVDGLFEVGLPKIKLSSILRDYPVVCPKMDKDSIERVERIVGMAVQEQGEDQDLSVLLKSMSEKIGKADRYREGMASLAKNMGLDDISSPENIAIMMNASAMAEKLTKFVDLRCAALANPKATQSLQRLSEKAKRIREDRKKLRWLKAFRTSNLPDVPYSVEETARSLTRKSAFWAKIQEVITRKRPKKIKDLEDFVKRIAAGPVPSDFMNTASLVLEYQSHIEMRNKLKWDAKKIIPPNLAKFETPFSKMASISAWLTSSDKTSRKTMEKAMTLSKEDFMRLSRLRKGYSRIKIPNWLTRSEIEHILSDMELTGHVNDTGREVLDWVDLQAESWKEIDDICLKAQTKTLSSYKSVAALMDEINALWEDPEFEKALVLVGDALNVHGIEKLKIFDILPETLDSVRFLRKALPNARISSQLPNLDYEDVLHALEDVMDQRKAVTLLQTAESIYVTAPVKAKPFLDMISDGATAEEAYEAYASSAGKDTRTDQNDPHDENSPI